MKTRKEKVIVILLLLFCILLLVSGIAAFHDSGSWKTAADMVLFILLPLLQMGICIDYYHYLHLQQNILEDKEKLQARKIHEQKEENDALHAQRTKQKFEMRMQQYEENAIHRKQHKKEIDPDELKEMLSEETKQDRITKK
jgi:uncharacterized membrane protein YhiD involved in acid resistance